MLENDGGESIVEFPSIGQVGEGVVTGEVSDLLLRLLDLGQVVDHCGHVKLDGIADWGQCDDDLDTATVVGDAGHLHRDFLVLGQGEIELLAQSVPVGLSGEFEDGSTQQRLVIYAEQAGRRVVETADRS